MYGIISMVWRKRGKLCTIAGLLFVLFIISRKVFYKNNLLQNASKGYKLNGKRSLGSDLKSDSRNVEDRNKRKNEELNFVPMEPRKMKLHEKDLKGRKAESHKKR